MPPRQAGLSKEKIVATAIDLLEAGGAEGLSMRKLATAMGVVPMAFYNHFEDRDALARLHGNLTIGFAPLH